MSARMYLKVNWDKCPKCGKIREIVIQGVCHRRGRIEKPLRAIGWDCRECGRSKQAIIIEGLTEGLNFGTIK